MDADKNQLYRQLTEDIQSIRVSKSIFSKPDPSIEEEATKIYSQARTHRNRLVIFYIIYTIVFTLFVFAILCLQAYARLVLGKQDFQVVSEWTLDILVSGMFGQFIFLLTIVTRRVWDYTPFFDHLHHINDDHDSKTSRSSKLKN